MFKVTSTYSKVDGGDLLDYIPEIRHFGGFVSRFRANQPGFVGFTHVMTDDLTQLILTTIWENQTASDAASLAETQQEEVMAAKNSLSEFLNKFQIANSKEQQSY